MCNARNDECTNLDTIDLWIARSSCPINCRIVSSESFQILWVGIPVSQFILSLGDSVAATKYPRKFCRERHNLLGYFVAARIYCRCI